MFLAGFIILFSVGVGIIVKLEVDFYFRHITKGGETVFSLMIGYFRKRILYFAAAILSLAASFVSLAI